MFTELVNYLTRDERPFMDLLDAKGQLLDPIPVNDNAANDNDASLAGGVSPDVAA